jgi:hypothetical protein
MAKRMKKQRKTLEKQHRRLFSRIADDLDIISPKVNRARKGTLSVSVATYGAYEMPIEGWSAVDAKLGGRSLKK